MFILSHKDALFALMANLFAQASYSYNDTSLSLELYNVYKVPSSQMGIYSLITYFFYCPVSFLTPRLLPNTPYKIIITSTFFVIFLACMIKGPSLIVGLPESKSVLTVGLALSGGAPASIFVTCLADIFLTF